MTFPLYSAALNTNDTRNRNLAAVFQAIREHQGLSRSEIGKSMPFSLQTMTNVVQELIGIGMVEEFERPESGKRGSPHRGLRAVPGRAYALGVQIRWNSCLMVLIDLGFRVVAERTVEMTHFDAEAYVDELAAHIADFVDANATRDIWACGISAPILLDGRNVPQYLHRQWGDTKWIRNFWNVMSVERFREKLGASLPFPVSIINNPQAAGIAEAHVRPPAARFIYIHLGIGLGAAFVTDRTISHNVWPHAGEIGHIVVKGRIVGASLSVSSLRTALDFDTAQGSFEPIVETAFAQGCPALSQWFEDAAEVLRFIISFLENAMWPDGILIGGFVPRPILERLVEEAYPLDPSVVPEADDPARILPRFDVALRSAEGIPLGAAISRLDIRSNPEFPDLIGRHRKSG